MKNKSTINKKKYLVKNTSIKLKLESVLSNLVIILVIKAWNSKNCCSRVLNKFLIFISFGGS